MSWKTYTDENGKPDTIGTDGGVILADEEHEWGARITLEQPGAGSAFGITCGIYGWMVHTVHFAHLEEAQKAFAAMKPDLDVILQMIPARSDPNVDQKMNDVSTAISAFVDKFP